MYEIDDFERKADDFALFARIFSYLDDRPNSSFREIAEHLGGEMNAQKISDFIKRLEEGLGEQLINRKAKSKNNTLTPAAERVYKEGNDASGPIKSWPRRKRDVIKIAAPNLLIHSVLPKIIPAYRTYFRERGIEADIRISERRELDDIVESIVNGTLDILLFWSHEGKARQISYLAQEPRVKVDEDPFDVKFDVLMVCPPDHEFVREAREHGNPARKGSWKLDLARLGNELVYVLPPRRQPLYDMLPPPKDPSRRLERDTNMDIFAMVRCHVREGIGLVPAIYPELNEMRRKGQIFYAPVTAKGVEADRLKVRIGCITRSGVENLRKEARKFFDLARPVIEEASTHEYSQRAIETLPGTLAEYEGYSFCSFVMQNNETFGVPRWFRGRLEWETDRGEPVAGERSVEGRLRGSFVAETERDWEFEAAGWLKKGVDPRDRLFIFEGVGRTPKQSNTIECTFNNFIKLNRDGKDQEALVGVWSGRDDRGLATVAPMMLSRERLGKDAIRQIINMASFRFLSIPEACGPEGEE